MSAHANTRVAPSRRQPRRPLPPRLHPSGRARRVLALTLVMCAVPVLVSFSTALSRPSNSSFTINAVEWLRDHGAAGFASSVESVYYSLAAPATGGPALRRLRLHGHTVASVHPPDIAPVIHPPLAGEGVWTPTETWSGADPPVQITQFRSDPNYPQMVAGVAWIDPRRTSIVVYPGRLEPSVNLPRGLMEVPPSLRARLLATFNSGFKLEDSHGGFALGGTTYAPLKPGLGTFVHYSDGRVDVASWSSGPRAPTGVDYARQNLPLTVIGADPIPISTTAHSGGRPWATRSGCGARASASTPAGTWSTPRPAIRRSSPWPRS